MQAKSESMRESRELFSKEMRSLPASLLVAGLFASCDALVVAPSLRSMTSTRVAALRRSCGLLGAAAPGGAVDSHRWGLLADWARTRDILFGKWDVGNVNGGLRGAIATEDVREGEVLVSAPEAAVLSVRQADSCPLPGYFVDPGYWDSIANKWEMRMALLLLFEKSLGEKSAWAPWLDMLPNSFGLPLTFCDSELEDLQDHLFIANLRVERAFWDDQHAALQASMRQAPSKGELLWALSCVSSRTFTCEYGGRLPPAQIMFPVADMFNHDSGVQTGFRFENGRYEITACRAAKGEQLLISYGPEPNEVLLQNYGFVPTHNVHDQVGVFERELWLVVKELHDEEESVEPRVRVLTALINGFKQAASPDSDAGAASVTAPLRALRGVSFVTGTNSGGEAGRGYRFQVSTDGQVEEELLVYSRALMLNSQDFSRLGLSGILLMLSSKKAAAVSADNEAAGRALLELVLGYQLSPMLQLSSIEDDESLLSHCTTEGDASVVEGLEGNRLMCVRYRLQRKLLLMRAIARLATSS